MIWILSFFLFFCMLNPVSSWCFPGPLSGYIGSWTCRRSCPAPSYTPLASSILPLTWEITRLPRLLHRRRWPLRGNAGRFRWPLVLWNRTQRNLAELWADMREAVHPGQPGFPGWFIRQITKSCCWEQNRVGRGGKWAGSSGECRWSGPSQEEYPETCCEWAGLPGCPGHVWISGRWCSTFGLHLPVQLYWLIWLLFNLPNKQACPFQKCQSQIGLVRNTANFSWCASLKWAHLWLFAMVHNLPLLFLSLLTVFHTAAASGMQSPKNNKHTNNKVTLASWLVLLAHFLSLIIF